MLTNNSFRYVLVIFGLTLCTSMQGSDSGRLSSADERLEEAALMNAPKLWWVAENALDKKRSCAKKLGEYVWWSAKRRNGLNKMVKGLAMIPTAIVTGVATGLAAGVGLKNNLSGRALDSIRGSEELIRYTFIAYKKKVLVKMERHMVFAENDEGIFKMKSKKIEYAELRKFKKVSIKGDAKKDYVRFVLKSLRKGVSNLFARMCDRNIYINKPVLVGGQQYDYRYPFFKQYVAKDEDKFTENDDKRNHNQFKKFMEKLIKTDTSKKTRKAKNKSGARKTHFDRLLEDTSMSTTLINAMYNKEAQWNSDEDAEEKTWKQIRSARNKREI